MSLILIAMTKNSDSFELNWTANVEATLANGSDIFWESVYMVMAEALCQRSPLFKRRRYDKKFYVYFGVEGDTPEVAEQTGVSLVEQTLDSASFDWVSVRCLRIMPNELLDQNSASIDSSGHMPPEAVIIPFPNRIREN